MGADTKVLNSKHPTIIYIVSIGHSGSTLLELLIGRHKEVTGVGEIKGLYPKQALSANKPLRAKRCNCNDINPLDCPFWQQVDSHQLNKYGFGLEDLDLNSASDHIFTSHNHAVFETVADISQCSFIVDGSKSHQRLSRLLTLNDLQIKVIHLLRAPVANVYSNMCKGNSLLQASRNWVWNYLYTQYLLRNTDHYSLNYEDLAENPGVVMASLMDWLGLTYNKQQLQWNKSILHRIGGNRRVRKSTDARIIPDQRWCTALTIWQKLAIKFSIAGFWGYYWLRDSMGLSSPRYHAFLDSQVDSKLL